FRIDVMHMLLKHPDMLDNPANPGWRPGLPDSRRQLWAYNKNFPEVITAVRGIRRVMDEFPGSVAVGEVSGTAEQVSRYYGGDSLNGLHLAFNFQLIKESESFGGYTHWDAEAIRRIVSHSER